MATHRQATFINLNGPLPASHLDRFFKTYPNFQHNPSTPSGEEYRRLRRSQGWLRGSPEGDEAWAEFRLALVKEFNRLFGTDKYDLLAWQNLCALVGIEKEYKTWESCFRAIKSRYFNIVDVIDARRLGNGEAQTFPTREAELEHRKRTLSYFPFNSPEAGNLLRQLLRNPRTDVATNKKALRSSPPDMQDSRHEKPAEEFARPRINKRETRVAKKDRIDRMIVETIEATEAQASDESASE